MTESLSSHTTEPGRIARHAMQANQTGWKRWLPGLNTLRQYESSWLRHDLVAGLVMTTMLVPVGIAYAEASGVPGINGLYATIVPLLAYALFGPSRILVLGPDSALASVILTVVLPLSAGEPRRAVALAGMMAIVSGVVCVAAGLARLGFITELLSKPIRYGYMNGIALTVLLSQVPKLLGFSATANGPVRQAWGIVGNVLRGNTNPMALAIGASTLALILLLKRWPRVPGILIAVVAATVVVAAFGLAKARRVRARSSAARIALTTSTPCPRRRPGTDPHGWRRGCTRFIRGHERAFSNLCGASAYTGRPKPGDGSPWRRQSRRSLLSGLPHQQQLIAHPSGRGGGRKDPADGGGGRPRHRIAAGGRALTCSSICRTPPWLPSSLPRLLAWSRSPTCAASIASSAGSSGFRWPASRAWPSSAPFRALVSRL